MAAGVKGNVIAEVVIDPGGDVIDAKIFRSIPMLDGAALAAVRNWHFQPIHGQRPACARADVRDRQLHAGSLTAHDPFVQ